MAEIVHDIAPGARIAVAAAGTSLEFIARVNDLVNTFGADIIVDDLGFSFEPYFEDGLLAQAVAGVKDQVVFVSSAGNAARKHYEADYKDNSNLHDFGLRAGGSTDLTMDVLVGPGEFLFTVLQWNDQFGLSANDYDLFLFDGAETTIGASSRDLQDGTQDPREFVCYFNPAFFQVRSKIVVGRFSGAGRRLEMFLRGGIQIDEYNVPDGSIFGHSAVPGVLAVGAIDAADPGNDTIEPFSSRGPSRIDFSSLQDAGAGVIDVPNLNFSSLSGFDGTSYRGQTFIALPGLAQELTIYVRPKAIHFRVLLTEVDKADGKIFPRTVLFESSRLTTPSSGPLTPITVDLGGINLVSGQLYAFYWIPLLWYRRTHKTMPTITHVQGQLFLIRVKTFIQKDK